MQSTVVVLVLLAAAMHATWNALVKGSRDRLLTQELVSRLPERPQLFYIGDRSEPAMIRDMPREEGDEFDKDVVWLLSERATDPEFAATNELFSQGNAPICCMRILNRR